MSRKTPKPWYYYAVVVLMALLFALKDRIADKIWVPILAGTIMVLGFGIMLAQGIREWKKTDEEILSGFAGVFSGKRKEIGSIRVTADQIVAFLVGLVPTVGFVAFGVIGVVHGVWWFTIPPALVLLTVSVRPILAAVRSFAADNFPGKGESFRRDPADPGERHLRKSEYPDPWDRPDRK